MRKHSSRDGGGASTPAKTPANPHISSTCPDERAANQLAIRGTWNLATELDKARLQCGLKKLTTTGANRAFIDGCVRLQYDDRVNGHAVFLMRYASDSSVNHTIQRRKHTLDRHRRHFLTATLEDLVFSPDERQQSVPVYAKAISSTKDSLGRRRVRQRRSDELQRCFFWTSPIAAGDVCTAHNKFTFTSGGQLSTLGIDEKQLAVGNGASNGIWMRSHESRIKRRCARTLRLPIHEVKSDVRQQFRASHCLRW
jgi:hypothetical protein